MSWVLQPSDLLADAQILTIVPPTLNTTIVSSNGALEFRKLKSGQAIYLPLNEQNTTRHQYLHFALQEKEQLYFFKVGLRLKTGSQVLWFSPNQMLYQPHPNLSGWLEVFLAFESLSPLEKLNWDSLIIQSQSDISKLSLQQFSVLDEVEFTKAFAPPELITLQDFETPLFLKSDVLFLQGKKFTSLDWGRRGRGRSLQIHTAYGNTGSLFYIPLIRTFRRDELSNRPVQFWFRAGQEISEFKMRFVEPRELNGLFQVLRQDLTMPWFKVEGQNWKKISLPAPDSDICGMLWELPAGVSQTFWLDDLNAVGTNKSR